MKFAREMEVFKHVEAVAKEVDQPLEHREGIVTEFVSMQQAEDFKLVLGSLIKLEKDFGKEYTTIIWPRGFLRHVFTSIRPVRSRHLTLVHSADWPA